MVKSHPMRLEDWSELVPYEEPKELQPMRKAHLTLRRVRLIVIVVLVVGFVALFAYASLTGSSPFFTRHSFEVSRQELSTEDVIFCPDGTSCHEMIRVSLKATVTNTGSVQLTSVDAWVNGTYLGSCNVGLLAGQHGLCHILLELPCGSLSGGLPYNMKAQAVFQDKKTATFSWTGSPTLSSTSC
jgi:hypothetical protein